MSLSSTTARRCTEPTATTTGARTGCCGGSSSREIVLGSCEAGPALTVDRDDATNALDLQARVYHHARPPGDDPGGRFRWLQGSDLNRRPVGYESRQD